MDDPSETDSYPAVTVRQEQKSTQRTFSYPARQIKRGYSQLGYHDRVSWFGKFDQLSLETPVSEPVLGLLSVDLYKNISQGKWR